MKKRALAIIIIGMSIGLMGCSNPMTAKNDSASNNSSTNQLAEDNKTEISLDKAKEIAVKDANLTLDQVTFVRAALDSDTEAKEYDIDFNYDNQEYDYKISTTDGKIINFAVEDKPNGDYNQISDLSQTSNASQSSASSGTAAASQTQTQTKAATQSTQSQTSTPKTTTTTQQAQVASQATNQTQSSQTNTTGITVEQAKAIALKHANLTSDKVSFLKAEVDVDNGVKEYEIDFTYNNKEYDYEINATTGSIISSEVENK